MARPGREIRLADQRPVDAGRRHFQMIGLLDRIGHVERRRNRAADLFAILDGHGAVVALGHDLQRQAVLATARRICTRTSSKPIADSDGLDRAGDLAYRIAQSVPQLPPSTCLRRTTSSDGLQAIGSVSAKSQPGIAARQKMGRRPILVSEHQPQPRLCAIGVVSMPFAGRPQAALGCRRALA